MFNPSQSIRDIADNQPSAVALFERFEIDVCYLADKSLKETCSELQLSLDQVLEKLQEDRDSESGFSDPFGFVLCAADSAYCSPTSPTDTKGLIRYAQNVIEKSGDHAHMLKAIEKLIEQLQRDLLSHIRKENAVNAASRGERQKSLLLRAWILSGLFFMAILGTLLGFSNLLAISGHHGSAGLPPAWMEGYGHAQVFGWIGSFILGIGFYSQPSSKHSTNLIPRLCLLLWVSGVTLRWIGNIYGWHWRVLLGTSITDGQGVWQSIGGQRSATTTVNEALSTTSTFPRTCVVDLPGASMLAIGLKEAGHATTYTGLRRFVCE
jgi:hypothetical protein